jgi:cell division protein FtsB
MLEQATTRLHSLEQSLIIERGKAKLHSSQSDKDAEINSLKQELKLKQNMIDELARDNMQLSDDVKRKDLKSRN